MAGEYASKTDVPVSKSRDEIERTLLRFGATGYGYAVQGARVMITFEVKGLRMTLPDRESFKRNSYGNLRPASAVERDYEQACRQRWRTLANGVKAKLALVDDGISTVEKEFLADIVVGDSTVGERLIPELREAVARAELPPLIPGDRKVIALPERSEGKR
jgi:hypothetical protein